MIGLRHIDISTDAAALQTTMQLVSALCSAEQLEKHHINCRAMRGFMPRMPDKHKIPKQQQHTVKLMFLHSMVTNFLRPFKSVAAAQHTGWSNPGALNDFHTCSAIIARSRNVVQLAADIPLRDLR